MAIQQLTQPIINPIAAFDATQSHVITFLAIGGAQVVGNRIVISDNQTGETVYDNRVITMQLAHTIPANTLTNGGYYNVVIYTIDSANNFSPASVPVPFYCYSQPTLTINNIPASSTIENGTYTFQGSYAQQENENLNSYQFILYDSNKTVLSQSDVIYYSSNNSLSYTFVGMSNDTSYYIELKGQTVNNTEITTGLLYFTVRYSQPASFAIVDLVNDCENGFIQISSNIVAIDGKSNPEPPIYIDNKEVDLREPDSWVRWDEGFNIKDDFTMRVWGRDFNDFEPIITLSNKNNTDSEPNKIEMKWMIADVMKILPDYTLVSGKNISIVNGYKTDINDLAIYGNSEQIKKDSIDFGMANSMTIDTTEDMFLDVDVYGNQYQATREGYNQINLNPLIGKTETKNRITYKINEDCSITVNGTPTKYTSFNLLGMSLKAGTYKFVDGLNSNNVFMQTLGDFPDTSQNHTFSLAEDGNATLYLVISTNAPTLNNVTLYPMIYAGTEDKPYEQYGASPSPSFPSEIETVGSNKNELDIQNIIVGGLVNGNIVSNTISRLVTKEPIPVKSSTTYNINFNEYGEFKGVRIGIHSLDSEGNFLKDSGWLNFSDTKQIIYTTAENCKSIRIVFSFSKTAQIVTSNTEYTEKIILDDFYNMKFKLEKGSIATPYSPYGMGSVEIDVVNKNLLVLDNVDEQNVSGMKYSCKNGEIEVQGTATTTLDLFFPCKIVGYNNICTLNASADGEIDNNTCAIRMLKEGKNVTNANSFGNVYRALKKSQIVSITADMKREKYQYICIHINKETTANFKLKVWLNWGADVADYTRSQSQTAIMPIQQEMLTGDYVADVEHHEWGKYALTGEEELGTNFDTNGSIFFGSFISNKDTDNEEMVCNNYLYQSSKTWQQISNYGFCGQIGSNNVFIRDDRFTNKTDFLNYLKQQYEAGTPVTIYYKLATPLDLPLTEEQKTVKNTLINAYEPTTNIYASDDLSLLKVSTTPIPSPKLPSKIYSSGDIENQLEDLGIINIDYTQGYFETTDTDFILKPDFVYNLSFDYIVNNTTTDLYFTVSYKNNGEIFDITNASQYTNKTTGRNNISFIVPADIPANSTLSIKFARTIIQADVSVSVNNVALVKGRFAADYQSSDIYNIYPTATQKNIFNYNDIYYIKNQNATLTFIQNGFSSEVVTTGEKSFFEFGFPNILQPGNKYAISYNSYGAIKSAKIYTMDKETGKTLEQITTENGVFTAPSNLYDIKAEFILDDSVTDNQVQVWNIQLESGEQVTEAETYTANGTDLTLEQPLRGIGNYRDLACLESPNILNPETQTAIVKGSTTYSLSQSGTTAYKFDYINEDNNIISSENMVSGQFTTPDNCIRIKFDTTSDIITTNKLQVNLGNTVMVYYPYVNEPSIIRYIGEVVLTGDEEWSRDLFNKYAFVLQNIRILDCMLPIWKKSNIQICSHFKVGTPGYDTENTNCFSINNGGVLVFQYEISRTTEEWKAYLKQQYEAGTPVIVNYVLANPTVEQLSSDNILALQNLKTYEGISNVFTNNSMPANLNLSYISGQSKQETKNAYVTLKCWNGNVMPYFIHSNYIDIPKETDKVFIWLRRKNNIFDLKIENLGDYGEDKPGNKGNPQVAITVDDTTTTTITITANTIDTATLSNVKFSKDNGATWDAEIPLDGLSSTDTYTFTGLQPATTYQIRVEATNVNGITGGITQQVITRAS